MMSSETKPKTTKRDDAQGDAIMLSVPWEIAKPVLEQMARDYLGIRMDIQATRGGDGSLQVKGTPKWGKERGDG